MTLLRIGSGFDVHAFGDEGPIILGGVRIPFERGFLAHSDGDVLIHAIIDAILGALALGDIGSHFPDHDQTYLNIDSFNLLKKVVMLMQEKGYRLVNLDSTIIAQAPKMQSHIMQMRINIAESLNVHFDQISVKATTTEQLGFTGRKEGIACQATVLLEKQTLENNK